MAKHWDSYLSHCRCVPLWAVLSTSRSWLCISHSHSNPPRCSFPTANVYERLVTLSTNLPHSMLIPFLQSHPHIEDLILGPCNNNTHRCPLTKRCHLPVLQHLTCPPTCVQVLTPGSSIRRLYVTFNDVQHNTFPICQLLNFRPIEMCSSLTILHLDFDSTALGLLQHVLAAAPVLSQLKLTESKFSCAVCHSVFIKG